MRPANIIVNAEIDETSKIFYVINGYMYSKHVIPKVYILELSI